MDPTFAGQARRLFAAVIADHREAESPATGCTAGDSDLVEGTLVDHVLDVLVAAVAEPELAPHVVHVDAPEKTLERRMTFDPDRGDRKAPDGEDVTPATRRTHIEPATNAVVVEDVEEIRTPFWGFDEEVPSAPPPADCSDCSRGLVSRGFDLICIRLDRKLELRGCHDHKDGFGCHVACGVVNGG